MCCGPQEVVQCDDRWRVMDVSCPPIPAGYKEVCSHTLPVSVRDFYAYILSGTSRWMQAQHQEVRVGAGHGMGQPGLGGEGGILVVLNHCR